MGQETVLEPFECFYMMIRGLILKYIPHPRKKPTIPLARKSIKKLYRLRKRRIDLTQG